MALHSARRARLVKHIEESPRGPRVAALFDLDQTLLAGFSATSFFRERFVSGRMAPREIVESLLGGLSFAAGRTGFSGFMSASTAAYRGIAESMLEEIGEEVFHKHLATQIYPESRALVEAHRRRGHTVAIVSSATRYQADPLARDMGIEHVLCTELEVENGVFTGRVVHPTCYGEGKAIAARKLAAEYDLDLAQSYFYTDSHEDLPLLEAVGHPHPLNPDRRLAQIAKERQWPLQRFHSRGTPSLTEIARTSLVYASIIPSMWVGAAAGLLNRSRREGVNVAAGLWADLATSLSGVDLRIEGEQHLWSHRPAVFIFNHQSGFDPILLFKMLRRDLTGVGKQEILYNPVFRPGLRRRRGGVHRPRRQLEGDQGAGAGGSGLAGGPLSGDCPRGDALADAAHRPIQEGRVSHRHAGEGADRPDRVQERPRRLAEGRVGGAPDDGRSGGVEADLDGALEHGESRREDREDPAALRGHSRGLSCRGLAPRRR